MTKYGLGKDGNARPAEPARRLRQFMRVRYRRKVPDWPAHDEALALRRDIRLQAFSQWPLMAHSQPCPDILLDWRGVANVAKRPRLQIPRGSLLEEA